MRRRMIVLFIVLSVFALVPMAAQQAATKPSPQAAPAAAPAQKPDAAPAAPAAPRPMELADIIAWKNIGATAFSNDGSWFAYRMSPIEGDSEVFVRATDGDTVYKFPAGEAPSMAGGPRPAGRARPARRSSTLGSPPDSKWVAFTVYPTRAEGQRLRRQRRPVQAKMQLLDLATGQGRDASRTSAASRSPASAAAGWRLPRRPRPPAGRVRGLRRRLRRRQAAVRPPRPRSAEGSGSHPARPRDGPRFQHRQRGRVRVRQSRAATWRSSSTRRTRPATASSSATWRPASCRCSTATRPRTNAWRGRERATASPCVKGTEDKRYTDKVYAAVGLHRASGPRARAAARGVRPRLRQDVPGGHVDRPYRGPTWTRGPLGARLRHPHAEEVGCETRHSEAWRGRRATRRRSPKRQRHRPRRRRRTRRRSTSSCGTTRTRACSRSSRCRRRPTRTSATCPSTA